VKDIYKILFAELDKETDIHENVGVKRKQTLYSTTGLINNYITGN